MRAGMIVAMVVRTLGRRNHRGHPRPRGTRSDVERQAAPATRAKLAGTPSGRGPLRLAHDRHGDLIGIVMPDPQRQHRHHRLPRRPNRNTAASTTPTTSSPRAQQEVPGSGMCPDFDDERDASVKVPSQQRTINHAYARPVGHRTDDAALVEVAMRDTRPPSRQLPGGPRPHSRKPAPRCGSAAPTATGSSALARRRPHTPAPACSPLPRTLSSRTARAHRRCRSAPS
jgi:hypothetical protein